jgi:cephalosporin hydroxylase
VSPSLPDLAERFGTDKRPRYHDYIWLYEQLLEARRQEPLRLMEIGVSRGRSLRMWAEYLPQATIVGVDRDPKREHDSNRVQTIVADQADRAQLAAVLERCGRDWDLIIDDGGHRMDEQQASLGALFPAVRPGGVYVIEDVHTSFPDRHPGYGVKLGESTYDLIDRFARTGQMRSPYLSVAESRTLEASIAWCSYHFRPTKLHSDLAVICRKKGPR